MAVRLRYTDVDAMDKNIAELYSNIHQPYVKTTKNNYFESLNNMKEVIDEGVAKALPPKLEEKIRQLPDHGKIPMAQAFAIKKGGNWEHSFQSYIAHDKFSTSAGKVESIFHGIIK